MRQRLSLRPCIETHHQPFSLELNAFEVYSATNLRKRLHWRETSKLPFPEHRNSVVTTMPSSVPMYIDSSCDVISVVRRDSEIWKRNASILQADMPALLSFCRKKGKTDDKRRDSRTARILEFGSTTGTKTVHGNQHFHN